MTETHFDPLKLYGLEDYRKVVSLKTKRAARLAMQDDPKAFKIRGVWRIPGTRLNEICGITVPTGRPRRASDAQRNREDLERLEAAGKAARAK